MKVNVKNLIDRIKPFDDRDNIPKRWVVCGTPDEIMYLIRCKVKHLMHEVDLIHLEEMVKNGDKTQIYFFFECSAKRFGGSNNNDINYYFHRDIIKKAAQAMADEVDLAIMKNILSRK